MNNLYRYKKRFKSAFQKWVQKYQVNIALINIILIALFLLRSVGYFDPYLPLTIHIIVFVAVLLSIFLLGASARALILVAVMFLVTASVLRILKINVWAERTSMYSFEIFTIGVISDIFKLSFKRKSLSVYEE